MRFNRNLLKPCTLSENKIQKKNGRKVRWSIKSAIYSRIQKKKQLVNTYLSTTFNDISLFLCNEPFILVIPLS